MPKRSAHARWEHTLAEGTGSVELGSGSFKGPFSFHSRFADGPGTNPEELLAAAHAGCFSMTFVAVLEQAGFPAGYVETQAEVTLRQRDDGFRITRIALSVKAHVPEIGADRFELLRAEAEALCPVSRALAGVDEVIVRAELAT